MRVAQPTLKKNLGSADAQAHQLGPTFAILLPPSSRTDTAPRRPRIWQSEAKTFGSERFFYALLPNGNF